MSSSIPSLRRSLPGTLEALIVLLLVMLAPMPAMGATVTVAPGDTLAGVAARHGVSAAALAAANGLRDPNLIVAGTQLTLPGSATPTAPAASGGRHTVRAGETIAGIAGRYGVTTSRLAAANGITNPDLVREGTVLSIPGQGTTTAVPAVAVAGSPGVHVVRPGETLGALAGRFGVSIAALASANGIGNVNMVGAGTPLKIPGGVGAATQPVAVGVAPGVHRVASGETVGSIASRYGTTAARLVELNGLADPNLIAIGQSLRVPGVSGGQGAYIGVRTVPSAEVVALINGAAARYGVDPALARAIAYQESGYNHNVRSHAGAIGAMQLMPATAQWVGPLLVGRTLDPYSVRDNVDGGVAYLAWLLRRTPNARHAVAGYYQGLNALRARGMFDDTKDYVQSVMSHYGRV